MEMSFSTTTTKTLTLNQLILIKLTRKSNQIK